MTEPDLMAELDAAEAVMRQEEDGICAPAWTAGSQRLRERLEHAEAALAGASEGARLWMLDCAEVASLNRQRADKAEAALGRVRALAGEWAALEGINWEDSMAGAVLADAGRAVLAAMEEG